MRPGLLAATCFGMAAWFCNAPVFAQDHPPPLVSPDRVADVPPADGNPFPRFDDFSWRAFIALNWPAKTAAADRGQPDTTKKFGDPGLRVWETYKARYEVLKPDASAPAGWVEYKGNDPCGAAIAGPGKTLSAFNKFADFNQADRDLARAANPLMAQNRTYTRYEVRINKDQFDTIVQNKWYIRGNLPNVAQGTPAGRFKNGSIEVKAAWKIFTDADSAANRARYYVVKDALVIDPLASAGGSIVCKPQDVGLVGFHIAIKTPLRPQWIWSSFEHIDNVPPVGAGASREPDAKDAQAPYSFNDGNPARQQLAPVPAPPGITKDGGPDPTLAPMQVVRQFPIQDDTMKTNHDYWNLPEIKGTVWANYMLVMTQWPTVMSPESPSNAGAPFPPDSSNLANTTMETYHQAMSCMTCHQRVANKIGRDFVAFIGVDAADPPAPAPPAGPRDTTVSGGPPAAARRDPGIAEILDILRH